MMKRWGMIAAVLLLAFAALPRGHAAGVGPQNAGGRAQAASLAAAWLHEQQLPDGSFGLRRADGSTAPSASLTADVVYALALIGEDPAGAAWTKGGRSALDALAALAPGYVGSDAGQAGKVARAAVLSGADPRAFGGLDLLAIIRKAYDTGTGRYHPALLYRHTLAVEGLWRSGEAVPHAAWQALLDAQLPDGGWFWSFDATQSDVDSTGRVLQLLGGLAGHASAPAFARAVAYLFERQAAGGGWGVGYLPGPPNANSTALAVAGLLAAGYDPQSFCFRRGARGAIDSLLAFQEPGGAFVYVRQPGKEESRLMATVDALNALTQAQMPALGPDPVCRPLYLPTLLVR